MSRPPRQPNSYPALDLGELPVAAVNAALGTEPVPGRVRLSFQAHQHMVEDHPADYPVCFPALPVAVAFQQHLSPMGKLRALATRLNT